MTEINLPRRNLSDSVNLPAGDLVVSVLPGKPTGPEMPVGAPTVRIPESWSSCILLFFHDPKNPVFPAKVIPVNASAADFPLGHTVIFNVSSSMVVAKFGSELVKAAPGQSVTVKPPREGSGEYPIAIDCFFPGEKEPVALCRSSWQHEANARQILFVTPQPGQRIPGIWGVVDRAEDVADTAP